MTQRLYGRRIVPHAALLRSLSIVRQLQYLCPTPKKHSVLEIGAGSGYVGALLLELGFGYACTDIAQAFYLFQNHLLETFAPRGLRELATDRSNFWEGDVAAPGGAVHVPWWKFVVSEPNISFRADAVTCNHALCEMHPFARAFSLRATREVIGTSGFLMFEGWGSPVHTPIWQVGRDIASAGMIFAHNDMLASVVVGSDGLLAQGAQGFPMPGASALDEPAAFHPAIHINKDSIVGSRILEGRKRTSLTANLSFGDFEKTMRELTDDDRTDDERFIRFLGISNL
jgi:hypothetical protein